MMILVLKDASADCFRQAMTSLVAADAAIDIINENFIFAGFTLAQPPLEQLSSLVNLGTANAVLYFVVVQHDAKV